MYLEPLAVVASPDGREAGPLVIRIRIVTERRRSRVPAHRVLDRHRRPGVSRARGSSASPTRWALTPGRQGVDTRAWRTTSRTCWRRDASTVSRCAIASSCARWVTTCATKTASISLNQAAYFEARARGGAALLLVGSVSIAYPRGSFGDSPDVAAERLSSCPGSPTSPTGCTITVRASPRSWCTTARCRCSTWRGACRCSCRACPSPDPRPVLGW